jgi:hypothetical protein
MRSKVQLLLRLRGARERLRDVAAAAVAGAEARRGQAAAAEAASRHAETALLDGAAARLGQTNDARGLYLLHDEVQLTRAQIDAAAQELSARTVECDRLRVELLARERLLRACERQLEHARQERAEHEDHAEQSLADDLSAARSARSR